MGNIGVYCPHLICEISGINQLYVHHLPCGGEGKDSWYWNSFSRVKKKRKRNGIDTVESKKYGITLNCVLFIEQ